MNDTTREIGGALGIAVLGTVLTAGYRSGIADTTEDLPPELAEMANDGIGGAFRVAQMADMPELLQPAREAFVTGMHRSFLTAAVIGFVAAAVIGLRYPRKCSEPPQMTDEMLDRGAADPSPSRPGR